MYTLGSAAIRNLIDAYPALSGPLANKLIAFVGTPDELNNSGGVNPPLLITPNAIFIVLPADTSDPMKIAQPLTVAQIYTPVSAGINSWYWQTVGSPITAADILTKVIAGSGWTTLYQIMRGAYADIPFLPYVADGLPYWSRDPDDPALWIYDERLPGWQRMTDRIPLGACIMYPEEMRVPGGEVPLGYLPCDGSEVAIAAYPELYKKVRNYFGIPVNPVNFKLPTYSNHIIRFN